MAGVLDELGQEALPEVFSALLDAGVVETMDIVTTAKASDGMGGFTDSTTTTPFVNIPVSVKVDKKGGRFDAQGKPVTLQTSILTFPMTLDGELITVNLATDRLNVHERLPFPERTFRIICPADDAQVVNRFVCVMEQ